MQTQSNDRSRKDRVFEIVRQELLRVRREEVPDLHVDVQLQSCLVADLGLDSLSLVEAVVALEQALEIERLPLERLQDDACDRVTVESLVDLCLELTARGGACLA